MLRDLLKLQTLLSQFYAAVSKKDYAGLIAVASELAGLVGLAPEADALTSVINAAQKQDWNGVCVALERFFQVLAVHFAAVPKGIASDEAVWEEIQATFAPQAADQPAVVQMVEIPAMILAVLQLLGTLASWIASKK